MLIEQECQRQMRARSGPVYELAGERSNLASAAWRAAGSPLRVTQQRTPVRDADGAVVLNADGGPRYEDRWYLAASTRVGRRRSPKYTGPVEATPEQVAKWLAYQQARPVFEPVPRGLADDQVRLARQRTGDPMADITARHRRIRQAAAAGDPAALDAVHAMQALDDEWPHGLPEDASSQDTVRYQAALHRYFEVVSAPSLSGEEGAAAAEPDADHA